MGRVVLAFRNPPKPFHLHRALAHFHSAPFNHALTRVTGYLLVIILTVAIPFAIPRRRRASFTSFWATHHLLILVFPVLLIAHAAALPSRALDEAAPIPPRGYHQSRVVSHMIVFIAAPLAIYVVERVRRVVRASRASRVVAATRHGDDVVEVRLAKPAGWRHAPGQYVHVCVPSLSLYEWHPFTIASAPDDAFIGLVVRRAGDWTAALHGLLESGGVLPVAAPPPVHPPTKPRLPAALSAVLSRRLSRRSNTSSALVSVPSPTRDGATTTQRSPVDAPLKSTPQSLGTPLPSRRSSVATSLIRRATCQPWDEDEAEQDAEAAADKTVNAAAAAADTAELGGGAEVPPPCYASPFAGVPPSAAPAPSPPLRVCIDGPWGAPTQNVGDYDVAVLIGAGVGATPMAAVLRAAAHELLNARCGTCGAINERALRLRQQKIHLVWVAQRVAGTEWLVSLLASLAAADDGNRFNLALHVTRDTEAAVSAARASAGPAGDFHVEAGRPDWGTLLTRVADEARDVPGVARVGVFVCGPHALAVQVRRECGRVNAARKAAGGGRLHFFEELF